MPPEVISYRVSNYEFKYIIRAALGSVINKKKLLYRRCPQIIINISNFYEFPANLQTRHPRHQMKKALKQGTLDLWVAHAIAKLSEKTQLLENLKQEITNTSLNEQWVTEGVIQPQEIVQEVPLKRNQCKKCLKIFKRRI